MTHTSCWWKHSTSLPLKVTAEADRNSAVRFFASQYQVNKQLNAGISWPFGQAASFWSFFWPYGRWGGAPQALVEWGQKQSVAGLQPLASIFAQLSFRPVVRLNTKASGLESRSTQK